MALPAQIGPYQVVRELGRGGMGVVLEVRHPAHPRRLALKLITGHGLTPEALERFEREALLLARVKHRNVVAVHTFAHERGRPYLVTDLVEGRKLTEVAREGPMEPRRAAKITAALADGIAAIHAEGILHRDLKPDNVILRADDEPVLLDFGLARELDARSLTQSGTLVGTPAYMSPEQAAGDRAVPLDARADVYGVGAILFELLAGRPPFDVRGEVQKVVAVLTKEPSWPSETRKDIPPALEAILRRAMAKDRDERHPGTLALAHDLEQFLRGEKVETRAAPRARPRVAAIAGVAVVALGVLLGAIALRSGAPPDAPPRTPPIAPPPPPPVQVTSRTTTNAPPPPVDAPATPAGFRSTLAWLAREDTQDLVGARREVEKRRDWFRERPFRLKLPAVATDPNRTRVRFLDDRWLAVLANDRDVYVLDLAAESVALARVWNMPERRPHDVALGPPRQDGTRSAHIATYHGEFVATFDPSAKTAASLSRGTKTIGHPIGDPDVVPQNISRIAVSPDGQKVALGLSRPSPAQIVLRDSGDDRELWRRDLGVGEHTVSGVSFLDGGALLLVTADATTTSSVVALLDARTGADVCDRVTIGGEVLSLSVGPHDEVSMAPYSGLFLTKQPLRDLAALADLPMPDEEGPIAHALRGDFVYAVSQRGPTVFTVRKLGAPEKLIRPKQLRGRCSSDLTGAATMDISPDGTFVAVAGSLDGEGRVLEVWPAGDGAPR